MTMQQIVGPREVFWFEDGTTYSRNIDPEILELDDHIVNGDWMKPFPNTKEDNFALGMVESLEQSDIGGCLVAEHGRVNRYSVPRIL